MPKIHPSPALCDDVARVADLADVPPEKRASFYGLLCGTVHAVQSRARRTKPGPELIEAADAARTLHEALGSLNKDDREWIERLLAELPEWSDAAISLRNLPQTVWLLATLFSTAIGNSPPSGPGKAARHGQRGRRRGTVKNVIYQKFVFELLVSVGVNGGDLSFDKNYRTGTLLDAMKILAPHLPDGVVPDKPPLGILQRLITEYRQISRELASIDI
jgi:hypothetical protein